MALRTAPARCAVSERARCDDRMMPAHNYADGWHSVHAARLAWLHAGWQASSGVSVVDRCADAR